MSNPAVVKDIEFAQFLREKLPETQAVQAVACLIHFHNVSVKQSWYATIFWVIVNENTERIDAVFECMARNTASDPGMAMLAISALSIQIGIADFPATLEEFPAKFAAHFYGKDPSANAVFPDEYEEIHSA